MAKVIEQYTNGSYTKMRPGTVVLDYTLSCYWSVLSVEGNIVHLQNLSKGGKYAVKMDVSDETTHNTFVLLDLVEDFNRYEAMLINALEWAINVSEQATHDLIRAMEITSDELAAIGYDKDNFPALHAWANE